MENDVYLMGNEVYFMASVTAKDIPREQKIATDTWNFYKKYYHAEDSVEFWLVLGEELDLLMEKYQNHPLCGKMLYVYLEMILERTDKRKRGGEKVRCSME